MYRSTFFPQPSAAGGRCKGVHDRAFVLALRLLAGEILEFRDEYGRHWRATAHALLWVIAGEAAPILQGSAGDVAIEVSRRGLDEQRREIG